MKNRITTFLLKSVAFTALLACGTNPVPPGIEDFAGDPDDSLVDLAEGERIGVS